MKSNTSADTSKVVEYTPSCDGGSFLKLLYNPFWVCIPTNSTLTDGTEAVVVCSGPHSGAGTTAFVNKSTKKLLYFSYRNCFSKLPNGTTTDSMWGCLIRTGQMVVGAAMLRYFSGNGGPLPDNTAEKLHSKALPLFRDSPSAPLSIHRVEEEAHKNNIRYGAMLTPTQTAIALGNAMERYRERGGDIPVTLCCSNRTIDEAVVLEHLENETRIILLIPVVMGISKLSAAYEKMLMKFLDMPTSCGIAGGIGKASLYIFGRQGRSLFYMDPHYVQKAYTKTEKTGTVIGLRGRFPLERLGSCMMLGFYLHSVDDYREFAAGLDHANSFVAFPLISTIKKPEEPSHGLEAGDAEPEAISHTQTYSLEAE